MFDTTLLSKRGKYVYRGESLTFSHIDKNKIGGTIFVFKNQRGWKRISLVNCQKSLWEDISESPKLQELIAKSEGSTNKLKLPKNPE